MAIEAKINVQEDKKSEWTFPVLMELVVSPDGIYVPKDKVLVLFFEERTGVVVYDPSGFYSEHETLNFHDWDSCYNSNSWKKFEGTLTISNKK